MIQSKNYRHWVIAVFIALLWAGGHVTWVDSPAAADSLAACRVAAVTFDQDSYTTGQPIAVTVSVVDALDNPLIGANIAATVIRQSIAVDAAGLDLIDRSGDYENTYTQTQLPGLYIFDFTVSDPTGLRFAPCTASAQVSVVAAATSTPTPTFTPTATATATPTETPTNTPTPTATPAPPTIVTAPETLQTTLCSLRETTVIRVANAVGLVSVRLEVSYNPAIIQIIDADAARQGVQIRVGSAFSNGAIVENQVDTQLGHVVFEANVIGQPPLPATTDLAAIDWRPQQVGLSPVAISPLTLLDTTNQPISAVAQNGAVEVLFVPNCLFGSAQLQGRTDHSGITVTTAAGQHTVTLSDGSFGVPAAAGLRFDYPGFISVQADIPPTLTAADDPPVTLAPLALPAGDINLDGVVNILDLALIAANQSTATPTTDLNLDGRVDILDLSLAAGNYQLHTPLAAIVNRQ
jgi:hypothetical protein